MKNNPVISFFIIRILHRMTAKAMGVPYQPGTPALRVYAGFTQEQLRKLPEAEIPAVQERMYQAARRMGSLIRMLLFVRSDTRARRAAFWLYRNIGIALDGPCPGEFAVRCCYFSKFYSPPMCRVMSAMDRGLFAGLFGGGELAFLSRITEGSPCCRAVFVSDETRSEP